MFQAALQTLEPNFPPGVLQSDPRYSNLYFDMSSGGSYRGPWNEGKSTKLGEEWQYIEDPMQFVLESNGLTSLEPEGTPRTLADVETMNEQMSQLRSEEVNMAVPIGEQVWSQSEMEKMNKKPK
jgi:Mn-containing catalase